MKHFSFSFRLRQALAVGLLGLFFAFSFHLAQPAGRPGAAGAFAAFEGAEDEEADDDRAFPDRPDLALEQDADLTRDPATGTVPRERLLAAARFNEAALQGLAQRGAATTTSSLAAANWAERGPSNVGGRILALLVDPADATGNTVWAGTAGGGLWKATAANTAGASWTNVNSFLSHLAVSAIAAVPGTSPEVLYCGTGEGFNNADAIQGNGIWKSINGGLTWAPLLNTNNANFANVQKIVVHPVSKDVYAATRAGLWRSQDGGATWNAVLSQTTAQPSLSSRIADVEIAADNTLFVAAGIFATDGIYRSATGNVGSWTKLNTLAGSGLPTTGYQRIELACAPSSASRVYAAFQSSATRGVLDIYRSLDGGTSWQALSKPTDADPGIGADYSRTQAWYDLPLAVSPTDPNTLWAGGVDLFKTSNAGAATASSATWQQVTHWYGGYGFQYVHADQHAIAFPAGASGKVYFGNDGGFFFSNNPAAATPTLTAAITGLNVTQFYALAAHPTNVNYFLAGAQDNGSQRFNAAGINATSRASGGDGGYCAIDQVTGTVQFTSYVYNQYYRSNNGGVSFASFGINSSAGSFINPFEYDSRAGVLYAAYNNDTYLAWTNAGTTDRTTTTISPSLGAGAGKVTHVAVSPLTNNRIYIGTNAGKVLRVDNANTATPTITTLRSGPAGTSVSCIAIDPANENHQLVTYANYGTVSVMETTNATAATPTWTSVEGALPDMPVRWALFDPGNPARAILATEMGVYATEQLNGASTVWTPLSKMVNTRVSMLRYRPSDKLVAASTHGRGLFTSAIFNPAPLPVTLSSFTGSRTAQGAALRWQTASELHARSFEVERSANAVDFVRLGSVAAAGTSTSPRTYNYTDGTAGTGTRYYRLRQVDLDGSSAYSPVVAVQASGNATGQTLLSSVYPNPFSTKLTLELGLVPAGEVALVLTDMQGRQAYATTVHAAVRTISVALPGTLASGSYVLTVQANGLKASRRVVRQ